MSMFAVANTERIPLPDQSVDLVMGSPPYCDARTYDDGTLPAGHVVSLDCAGWVEWMLRVTTEALRVSRGAVIWVAAGVTRDRTYWPACEGLMWEWWKRGGSAYRPCYWHRVGIPGSGGDQWFRADVEYVMCFKRDGALPWADNTAMGQAPKYGPGGLPSHRTKYGARTRKERNEIQAYVPPDIANPGTMISTGAAGGGTLGHSLAHDNEAPYPEKLASHFIASLCPPGGTVLDPFSGSGTTVAAAMGLGRNGIGFDLRSSQAILSCRRCATVTPGFVFA